MNSETITISFALQLISWLFVLLSLGWAIRTLPVDALRAEPRLQHLLFGAMVVLMLTWTFRAGLSQGLSIHFLGITTLVLMFGWDLAVLAGALALVGITIVGIEDWSRLGLNTLTIVIIPATVTLLILRFVERSIPPNFFAYLFLVAFLGGGVTVASSGLSLGVLLGLDGVLSWGTIYHEYVRYLPLISFPEGLINGIIMTAMMVFHPDWIRTFDAKVYIDSQ